MNPPTFEDVKNASATIEPYAHRTPILKSEFINRLINGRVFFKCENFQKAGAFKFRGALNSVSQLSRGELKTGVATHSSGNFAQALSLAALYRGIKARIVMPSTAPTIKKAAVVSYGGKITYCKPTLAAREAALAEVVEKTGATFIHPYNQQSVIAGQGTATLEILRDLSEVDAIVAPIGGGGLLSGTAIAAKSVNPGIMVYGAEPLGAADAKASFDSGEIVPSVDPETICDGLLTSLGDITFGIVRKYVDDIITVEDEFTFEAMKLIFERMKIVVEPSAAIALAAVMKRDSLFADKTTAIILSGGNVDLDSLPWLKKHGRG